VVLARSCHLPFGVDASKRRRDWARQALSEQGSCRSGVDACRPSRAQARVFLVMSGVAEDAAPVAARLRVVSPPIQDYDAIESAEPRAAPLLFNKVRLASVQHDSARGCTLIGFVAVGTHRHAVTTTSHTSLPYVVCSSGSPSLERWLYLPLPQLPLACLLALRGLFSSCILFCCRRGQISGAARCSTSRGTPPAPTCASGSS